MSDNDEKFDEMDFLAVVNQHDQEEKEEEVTEYTFGSANDEDFDDLMSNDGTDDNGPDANDEDNDDQEEEDEEEEDQGSTASDLELLQKLFSGPPTDEEVLFLISDRSGCGLPQLVLKKRHMADDRFDLLRGVLTLMQRLLHLDDDVLSHWMGGGEGDEDLNDGDAEWGPPCILRFLFQIVDNYFERIVNSEMVDDLDDLPLLYDSSRSLSLYDLIASVCCAFVMGLGEEHLNIAEEVLFEALFSGSFLPSALASDVLVFIARVPTNATSFNFDLTVVLFSLLDALYIEDEYLLQQTGNSSSIARLESAKLLSLTLPQEALTQLLFRLFRYLNRAEIKAVKEIFSPKQFMHLWKHLPARTVSREEVLRIDIPNSRGGEHYDKLYALTQRDHTSLPSLASAYVATSAVDEYRLLLHLRLLVRSLQCHHSRACLEAEEEEKVPANQPLNSTQVMAVFSRARTSLLCCRPSPNSSLSSLEEGKEGLVIRPRTVLYRHETVLLLLRLIDLCLSSPPSNISVASASDLFFYQSPKFADLLQQLLLLLHRNVDCFISEQAFLTLLVNLSLRRLFEEVVAKVVRESRKIRIGFTLTLKHLKNGYFMKSEERELFLGHLTKVYFELVNAEDDAALPSADQVLASLLLPHWDPSALPNKTPIKISFQVSKRSQDSGGEGGSNKRLRPSSASSLEKMKAFIGGGGSGSSPCLSPNSSKLRPLFKHLSAAIEMATKIRNGTTHSGVETEADSSSDNNSTVSISRRSENILVNLASRLFAAVNHLVENIEKTSLK